MKSSKSVVARKRTRAHARNEAGQSSEDDTLDVAISEKPIPKKGRTAAKKTETSPQSSPAITTAHAANAIQMRPAYAAASAAAAMYVPPVNSQWSQTDVAESSNNEVPTTTNSTNTKNTKHVTNAFQLIAQGSYTFRGRDMDLFNVTADWIGSGIDSQSQVTLRSPDVQRRLHALHIFNTAEPLRLYRGVSIAEAQTLFSAAQTRRKDAMKKRRREQTHTRNNAQEDENDERMERIDHDGEEGEEEDDDDDDDGIVHIEIDRLTSWSHSLDVARRFANGMFHRTSGVVMRVVLDRESIGRHVLIDMDLVADVGESEVILLPGTYAVRVLASDEDDEHDECDAAENNSEEDEEDGESNEAESIGEDDESDDAINSEEADE